MDSNTAIYFSIGELNSIEGAIEHVFTALPDLEEESRERFPHDKYMYLAYYKIFEGLYYLARAIELSKDSDIILRDPRDPRTSYKKYALGIIIEVTQGATMLVNIIKKNDTLNDRISHYTRNAKTNTVHNTLTTNTRGGIVGYNIKSEKPPSVFNKFKSHFVSLTPFSSKIRTRDKSISKKEQIALIDKNIFEILHSRRVSGQGHQSRERPDHYFNTLRLVESKGLKIPTLSDVLRLKIPTLSDVLDSYKSIYNNNSKNKSKNKPKNKPNNTTRKNSNQKQLPPPPVGYEGVYTVPKD